MKEKIKQAIEIYGRDVVSEAVSMVNIFDADGCYTTFEDRGMFEHAEAVEFIYFD
jgi:hypothetical protein